MGYSGLKYAGTAAAGAIARKAASDMYESGKRYMRSKKKTRTRKYSRSQPRTLYIGRPVGYGTAKRSLTLNEDGLLVDTRTLYSRDITAIGATTQNNINLRQREMINLVGFKLNLYARNLAVLSTDVLNFHYAFIHDKGRSQALLQDIDPVLEDDFFRGNGSARAIDFSTTLNGIELNCLNINNDLYTVLKRGTCSLTPVQTGSGIRKEGFCHREVWLPINRQIRYDAGENADIPTDGRIFFVWWVDRHVGQAAGGLPTANAMQLDLHCVTHWREPLN